MGILRSAEDFLERSRARNRAFPTEAREATSALETAAEGGRRLRAADEGVSRIIRGRSGAASPEVVAGLGGAGIGAVTGSIVDEDNRIRGAAAGGLAGLATGIAGTRLLTPAKGRASTPELQRALGTVAFGERATPRKSGFLNPLQKAYAKIVDESRAFRAVDELINGKGARGLTTLAGEARAYGSIAEQYAKDVLAPYLQKVKDIPNGREDVRAFAVARRDFDIRSKGGAAKTGMTDAELAAAIQSASPDVVAAADEMTGIYRDLLKLRRSAGVLDQAEYQRIVAAEDFYIPFQREFDELASPGVRSGVKSKIGNLVRKMDRTARASAPITDPFEELVFAISETHRRIGEQRVSNLLGTLAGDNPAVLGDLIREVPLTKIGSDPAKNTVRAVVKGEQKVFKLDPDLYEAWAGMAPRELSLAKQILQTAKRAVQAGTTLMPDFMAANVIRDNATAAIQESLKGVAKRSAVGGAVGATYGALTADPDESAFIEGLKGAGLGSGLAVLAPRALKAAQAMKWIATDDQIYREFLRSGGATDGLSVRTPADARKVLRQMSEKGVSPTDIINPRSWVEALRIIGRAGERSTRLAHFAELRAGGATSRQAAASARDVSLDFTKIGSATKGIASVTPFWNAQIQGWDKLGRLLKKPETYAAGAMTLTAPTLALWAINKDNPEYIKAPAWEKNLFWFIPDGKGGHYRMPKPFEIGFLFASLPERLADFAYSKANDRGISPAEVLSSSIVSMFTSAGRGTLPVPPGLSIPAEQALNKSLFTQRQIQSTRGLPEESEDIKTSAPAVAVAKTIAQVPGLRNLSWLVSPERLDHIATSLGGGAASTILDITTRATKAAGLDRRISPAFQKTPLLGRFQTQPGRYQSDQEASVRREFKRPQQVKISLDHKIEAFEAGEITLAQLQAFADRHQKAIRDYDRLAPKIRDLDEVGKLKREVSNSREYSRDERKRILVALSDLSVLVATGQRTFDEDK